MKRITFLTLLAFFLGSSTPGYAQDTTGTVAVGEKKKAEKKKAEPKKAKPKKAEPKKDVKPATMKAKAVKKDETKKDETKKADTDTKKADTDTKKAEVKVPIKPDGVPANVNTDDPASLFKGAVDAAKSGKWALLVGLIVMLLTWILNIFLKRRIPEDVLPWIAIGLGVIAQVAFHLAAGGSWLDAIVGGISMGMTASGGYSAVGKHIPGIGKKKKEATE
jgi:uncharacterized membrane protein